MKKKNEKRMNMQHTNLGAVKLAQKKRRGDCSTDTVECDLSTGLMT